MRTCRIAYRLTAVHTPRRKPIFSSPWRAQRRQFGIETITAVLIPPAVFGGLLISLWTYKCIMMVIFQNKIIYMPSVPPFSRSEKVSDYTVQTRPVQWTEHAIRSVDGTTIKLLEGSIPSPRPVSREVVVLYFQGNASSLPPRLPYLSRILSALQNDHTSTKYTIIALSYRGYWTSKGRSSQAGIELDAQASITWVLERYNPSAKIILWGQSIGAGAASVSLSNLLLQNDNSEQHFSRISGLLLETPFIDLRTMLIALYPQKFLPYRYLAPFLMSTWDSKTALTRVGEVKSDLKVLLIQAGDDELVPADNASVLERVCREGGLSVERAVVAGALHTEVMAKSQGRILIAKFIGSFGKVDE